MASLGTFGAAEREGDPAREPDTFDYYGETFTVRDRVGIMPLLKFAVVAQTGVDSSEMEALAAMHSLVMACIVTSDVPRFEKVATEHDADTEELMDICKALYQAVTARPTGQPSDSADGSQTTTTSSKVLLSSGASSWRNSPLGQRELAQAPEVYADVLPIREAASALAG